MKKFFIILIHFLYIFYFSFVSKANEKQKIITSHFNIIFNKKLIQSAQNIANILETIYKPISKTLGVYPITTRLLLKNTSTELNGFFLYLPRHITFYNLHHPDPYFIGNSDWLTLLCIHEFRHAVQYSIEYNSTPLLLRPIYFGSNIIAICGVHSFFKEGDAVGIETACSKSGRGRLPGWEKIYKINLIEESSLSFDKQLFGSLKYNTPDKYHIGYYLTTYIRRKYGSDAIKSIFEQNIRILPYLGFYHTIKKITKKSILALYKDMNKELLLIWKNQLEGLKITPSTQVTIKKTTDNIDYISPSIDQSGNLIAWKIGIGLRPQLVQVGNKIFNSPYLKKKSIL